jgi:hypothetical protein
MTNDRSKKTQPYCQSFKQIAFSELKMVIGSISGKENLYYYKHFSGQYLYKSFQFPNQFYFR